MFVLTRWMGLTSAHTTVGRDLEDCLEEEGLECGDWARLFLPLDCWGV